MLRFLNWRGEPMRRFATVQDMDDCIITRHNECVHPQDHWWCLGDVAMKRAAIRVAGQCQGHSRLLRGNHDIYKTKDYLEVFDEIYATRYMQPAFPGDVTLLFSHYPLHPSSIKPNWVNVHGHIHDNAPPGTLGPKYLNVSLEVTDYRPLNIEELRVMARQQLADVNHATTPSPVAS